MDPAVTASKLKSILKKSQILDEDDEDEATKKEREAYAREVAIKHAKTIQLRKDIEAEVLDSLLVLSQLPVHRDPEYTAASPAPGDVSEFKTRIKLFQPSDYDDLIEERNFNGLCGYTLCGKPRIKVPGTSAWKIVNSGRKDFNIVPKADIEKWCSTHCARRALYIKVQLNETAVWERAGNEILKIDLLRENAASDNLNDVVSKMDKMKIEDSRQTIQNLKELADERGESGRYGDDTTRVRVTIASKATSGVKDGEESVEVYDEDAHLMVDGYKTKIGTPRK